MKKILIDFLIILKNSYCLKKEIIKIFLNKQILKISKVLYKEGIIQDFFLEKQQNKLYIVIILKIYNNFNYFKTFKIVSKPSKSLFFSYKDILKLYEKQILYIFSTKFGYLTSIECKKFKIGGILLFYVK